MRREISEQQSARRCKQIRLLQTIERRKDDYSGCVFVLCLRVCVICKISARGDKKKVDGQAFNDRLVTVEKKKVFRPEFNIQKSTAYGELINT